MTFTRRGFLGLAGGLTIGFTLPLGRRRYFLEAAPAGPVAVTAFLHIGSDDIVTVLLNHSEMGQGIWTGLPMLIAEELEADWSKIRVKHAPVAPVYFHTSGRGQRTGGSNSTRSEYNRLREVGATARAMLVEAAARRWRTSPATLRAEAGHVVGGAKRLSFGALAADAAKLAPPAKVKLKDPASWKIIGKPHRRLDSLDKVTGRAQYGIDVSFPGLLTAVVMRSPTFGGKPTAVRAEAALKIPGVKRVVEVPSGVAVVAEHFWAAQLGRAALEVDWDGAGSEVDTAQYLATLRTLVQRRGQVAADKGDVETALASAATRLEAQYELPYLAHAAMEPLNATVRITGDRCEIWTGTQAQSNDQAAAAEILGLKPDDVDVHTLFLGGAFGRRGALGSDFVREAVHVARAAGAPVKTVWTREDDMRGGHYRPMFVHRVEGGLDAAGRPIAWRHTIAGQPIPRPGGRPDESGFEGIADSPYLGNLPAHLVTMHSPVTPVTVQWWRSVGNSHTAFAMESFIDELAHAGRQDPVALRRKLLANHPQHLRVLDAVAERAGWGKPLPSGVGRGVAIHESFSTVVGEVAEVSVERGRIRVHRVVCAVDCGVAVNPAGVVAQMESGIIYGLSAALHGAITIKQGRVQQSNFHDYSVVRMHEAPRIEVVIVPSDAPIGGTGEPSTPPIAPAVANAVFAATGQRLRTLPFRLARG